VVLADELADAEEELGEDAGGKDEVERSAEERADGGGGGAGGGGDLGVLDGAAAPGAGEVGDAREVDGGVEGDAVGGGCRDLLAGDGVFDGAAVNVDEVDLGVGLGEVAEVEVVAVAGAEDAEAADAGVGGHEEAFDVAAVGGVPVPLAAGG
jgi:hypothetical protein